MVLLLLRLLLFICLKVHLVRLKNPTACEQDKKKENIPSWAHRFEELFFRVVYKCPHTLQCLLDYLSYHISSEHEVYKKNQPNR